MNWDGPRSYGYGVDSFLHRLSPYKQPLGLRTFPENLDRAVLRFQGGETIKQWFDRCVKTFTPDGPEGCQIEDNLAAFAFVSWRPTNEIDLLSINLLRTDCSLRDYFDLTEQELITDYREVNRPHYFRLDLDYGTLGPIGTHPMPHVHFSPDDPPRFTLDSSRSSNIVVDFLDFIYRHFEPGKWLDWAERVWNDFYEPRDPERNPFGRIVAAYNESQIAVIRSLAAEISELVSVLANARDEMYDLRMNRDDRRVLSFPDLPE